jgi:prepilin-type N-terminal cleavage/methylation domain-containing protein
MRYSLEGTAMGTGRSDRGFTLVELIVVVVILATISALVIPSLLRSKISANYTCAGAALKVLVSQQSIWRTQDSDRNGRQDYWTRDVRGFYGVLGSNGKQVAFIDVALALADRAPAFGYAAPVNTTSPTKGYYLQAMTTDQGGNPYIDPSAPPAQAAPAAGACTNSARFGFVAFPSVYQTEGLFFFMVCEDGVIWQTDPGNVPPLTDRSTAAPPGTGTGWAQFGG